jgi:uncharacterized membrane protein YesL
MLGILLQLIIVAIILGLVIWLVQQIPGVAPFANIIRVVCIVLFIIWILYILMGLVSGGHLPALR